MASDIIKPDERLNKEKQSFVKSIVLAVVVLFIAMASRQTSGLFILPIIEKTKLTITDLSLAIAIGHLVWGIVQPLWGAMADRGKTFPVLLAGFLCLAAGQIGIIFANTPFSLVLTLGLLSPIGSAVGGVAILLKCLPSGLSDKERSVASGYINAGNAVGQFTLAPLLQYIISFRGYAAGLILLAGSAVTALIPSWFLCRKKDSGTVQKENENVRQGSGSKTSVKGQLGVAFRNSGYLMLHCSFFVCGFHVTFLSTHLPSEINLYGYAATVTAFCISIIGICNITGSISSGILGRYFPLKYILAIIYASRALCIVLYIIAPKTPLTFYIFAAIFGLIWSATVPPTAGLVGKLFGVRYLATLFGLVALTHQIGAFFGAWLGGIILQKTGSFFWLWRIDMLLAVFATSACLLIKEKKEI